jgi:uncharacterized protein
MEHIIPIIIHIGTQIKHMTITDDLPFVYSIPLDDKFIIYAPLNHIAFVGNKALVQIIGQLIKNPNKEANSDNEMIRILKNVGIFHSVRVDFPKIKRINSFSPTLCILMPTTACNLSCTYCYAENGLKEIRTLKWELAKKAIEIAHINSQKPKNGKFSLSFHGGGEPTLPNALVLKACDYARRLDPECHISVTSNCVWNKNFRNKILNFINEVSVSLDGNKITQDRQRPDKNGKGTFIHVMQTLNDLEKRQIPYGIRVTITKDSLSELNENIRFLCENTLCKSIQVEAVYNQGKAIGSGLTLNDSETFSRSFIKAYHYANSLGRNIHYSSARPYLITDRFCKATTDALIVTANGELTACYEVFDRTHQLAEDFLIGEIDKDNGIKLYEGKRRKLLKKIKENRNSCRDCFCYFHCAGDCPPKAFISQKSHDRFRCSVTRTITKELILDKIIENDGFWKGSQIAKENIQICDIQ